MTQPKKNSFLSLFASVQLALFLLFLLASTSIIGTLIPQNNPHTFYVEKYGPKTALFFQLLDIPDMYNSWWFLGLLGLFSLNLIVCSLERIPQVVRTLRRDGLTMPPEQLVKFSLHQEIALPVPLETAHGRVAALLTAQGWHARETEKGTGRFFFAEKGGWTRFGVYVVHCSILIILGGALVGSSAVARKLLHNPQFAFKGSIMLPEGESSDHLVAFKSGERLELGFQVRCDAFAIEYYPNGMPKTYRSRVTIIEKNAPVQTTDIEVNQPLTYKGVTFYQSSYQPYQNYRVSLKKQATGTETSAIVTTAKQMDWPKGGVSYGIVNRESQGEVTRRLKIWFTDNQGDPSIFWMNINQEAAIERPSGTYLLNIRQMYATGLQVTKDPGVWLVYGGCLLMLIGLYIAFFLSHRKVYVFVQPEANSSRILFAGEANKNRVGFESKFSELISKLEK
jgi:cytochrome c biogenesis protein